MKRILAIVVLALAAFTSSAQNLAFFRLNNGLTVYIWEDPTMTDVYGEVAVRAGSVNDPSQYTGLAHYLEHVMFKGTSKIGTLDWQAEEPVYNQIIAKYDQMADAATQAEKEAISKEINALSIEQAKYSVLNEYANLIEGIGGSGLNAATSFDVTFYHNRFPASSLYKWLQVASERFVSPVFRAFQSELETVYEEYNMGLDESSSQEQEFMLSKIFEGTPYARSVIGLGEHLKNPRLSQLIKFYSDWYVPENMALIIVGNVKAQSIVRLVNATFGRLAPKASPQREVYPNTAISGRKQYTWKQSRYPSVLMAFNGPATGAEDEVAMEVCTQLLSNRSNTGLLDRMTIAGDVMGAFASATSLGNQGRVLVQAVPYYDKNQGTYESSKRVEKLLKGVIAKVASGEFDPEMLGSIKMALCRDYDLQMESDAAKSGVIRNSFIYGLDLNKELDYKEKVLAITVDDIKAVAAKYFNSDCTVIYNEMGKAKKSDSKITKPSYDPIEPVVGKSSAYAEQFRASAAPDPAEKYIDFGKVTEKPVNDHSRFYYTKADKNDVFTLTLKYGANSTLFPYLKYGASLMNSAGIMGNLDSDSLKEEFANLGATYSISADDNYMYVTLRGYEQALESACILLTRLLLMPQLDEKQLGNVVGGAISERMMRKNMLEPLSGALREYMLYAKESRYVKELTDLQLVEMDISKLTGQVIEATKYAAEIHYSGQLPADQVYSLLSTSLPLYQGEKPSSSPLVRKTMDYTENTVFFIPSSSYQQAQIFFYIPMGEYDKAENVHRDAFNRYIGGGFNGLIMKQIREYNSMAYTAAGSVSSSGLPGSSQYFLGYVGTQNDKALEAIKLYLSILTDMPQSDANFASIRQFLMQQALCDQPDDRELSEYLAAIKLRGYADDPAKEEVPQIRDLKYQDIVDYYTKYVKGRPIVIGVIGNPKSVSAKDLAAFGKVITLGERQLFNKEDVLF